MSYTWIKSVVLACFFTVGFFPISHVFSHAHAAETSLLNASFDPTREFFKEYNAAFSRYWLKKTGKTITVYQSHGGSGNQSRAVVEGLKADVVSLALGHDVDLISSYPDFLSSSWQARLPYNSSPYTSTIVFLVNRGNPKNILDWNDLARPDVSVIMPNPKTSGGARWNYLAAWAWAERFYNNDEQNIQQYMKKFLSRVPIMDVSARAAVTTFTRRQIGDVLVTWESEALRIRRTVDKEDAFEIVVPSLSIMAEPPVAVIDRTVKRRSTHEVAEAYLGYLYSPEGQEIIARNFYRPRDEIILTKYRYDFPELKTITIDYFGGWAVTYQKHFRDGGLFDTLMPSLSP